jgi:subtilisin
MTGIEPWRRPARAYFPGIPAWGRPVSALPQEQFGVAAMDQVTRDWAWRGADGSGIRVCVLDSGVDAAHPLVGGVERAMEVVEGADGDLVVAPTESGDPAGHGTACASLIRAVAPNVSLTSVRVLTQGKHGSGAALLTGLRWAIDEGFDVINMSVSTSKVQFCAALRDLADEAYFRRCIVVASAHNMPVQSYPWPFAAVISVASHDGTDPMTYYYNPSPPVDFYARGVRVPVAWPGGRQIISTGNSFATPHVTAICALILSKHRLLTPFQLKSVLYLTAENVANPEGGAHAVD